MIIVKITGGIGNQLFQYSFGQYLSKQLNTAVLYDLQTDKIVINYIPRALGLYSFDIELNVATAREIKKMKFFNNGILERVERKMASKVPYLFKSYIVEKNDSPKINCFKIRDNCYYDGYWQSYKYQTNDKISLNNVSLNAIYTSKINRELVNLIKNSNSISIHIRRGDYISIKRNNSIFSICSNEYYNNSIEYIRTKVENPVFYIFCEVDDLNWAKDNFTGEQFKFITDNKVTTDLYLMSRCKHNIIANSTFSWWAAWLNSNADKIVIAPKQWYNGKLNLNTTNLILDSWIQM